MQELRGLPMKARCSSRLGWLYRSREARPAACLLIEGGTENQGVWKVIYLRISIQIFCSYNKK